MASTLASSTNHPTMSSIQNPSPNQNPDSTISTTDPSWIANAKGLIYQDDHDGFLDPSSTSIPPPDCGAQDGIGIGNGHLHYQCALCGKSQMLKAGTAGTKSQPEVRNLKCERCGGGTFNKIRPDKWVKFVAK